jgi:hypothetical protein
LSTSEARPAALQIQPTLKVKIPMHLEKFLCRLLACILLISHSVLVHADDSDFEKQQAYESWLGSEIGEFIDKTTPPNNVTPNGRGGSVYTFIKETRYTNGYGHLVDITKDYLYLYVSNKNLIYAWKYIKSDGTNACPDSSGLCSARSKERRTQEKRRSVQTSANAWLGEPMADRVKMTQENRHTEHVATLKKDTIGSTVLTLTYSDDSVSFPGGGYISYHAGPRGIIYGWSGVMDGKEVCVNPDIENICMNASGAYPGPSRRGRIGFLFDQVTTEIARSAGLPKPLGALIFRVEAGNLGERSGLKVGDIITKINGVALEDSNAMPSFGQLPVGTRLAFTVWRKRANQEIFLTLNQ